MASSGVLKGKSKKLDKLLNREEEFMRLNAELEEKTSHLINQAESVLRGQDELFRDDPPGATAVEYIADASQRQDDDVNSFQEPKAVEKQRPHSTKNPRLKSSQISNETKRRRPTSAQTTSAIHPSVKQRIPKDILQQRIELANTISTYEEQMTDEVYTPAMHDDPLPEAAADMGAEATIRFLKAKLRVMQEELDRMTEDAHAKEGDAEKDQLKLKQLTEELSRQRKHNANVQSQVEKYKKLYQESTKLKLANNEQTGVLKKELESMKRQQKQNSSEKNAMDVRLNRALEEIEKNKQLLAKAKESSMDSSSVEKKRTDQLLADNKRLEKQKGELMTAFKKQLKLIDILKRQKMHIESAKMLQFSEEEFVKALEWGS